MSRNRVARIDHASRQSRSAQAYSPTHRLRAPAPQPDADTGSQPHFRSAQQADPLLAQLRAAGGLVVAGAGLGIASPAKNSLFSIHLDKNKEAIEMGVTDAVVLVCMALAGALGGFIAITYGFKILFIQSR